MPQFLVHPPDVDPLLGTATLRDEEAHHLAQVLRARQGDPVEIFDGQRSRWSGVIAEIGAARVRVHGLRGLPANEPGLEIELIHALPKGERWEWILEKGTELGVARFWPVYSERSVARLSPARATDRQTRWNRVALAASKQCERARVPRVEPIQGLAETLAAMGLPAPREARLALTERTAGGASRPRLSARPHRVRLAVGPEGGWAPIDREALEGAGFAPQTLGPRILRTDTAGLAAVVLVLTWWGDLEPSPTE
jgi:16S rRNA (uracil1498-N3)-methyltransferase